MEDQLASIHLPLEWLVEARDAYDEKWNSELEYTTPDNLAQQTLTEQHSQFASWLLASLHTSGPCGELSSKLETSVMTRALHEVGGIKMPLPPVLSPKIIGWTLGSVIGRRGNDLPVVPALVPSDENIQMAFEGLVEHVLAIQGMDEPWPEMMQTAMYWRGYGLAEALRPDAGSGGPALKQLRLEAFSTMASAERVEVGNHLDKFNGRRNALSHIADDQSRTRFIDVIDEIRQSSGVDLTMRAMTQFVFSDVARAAREQPPPVVRRGAWEVMEHEIQVWI
ncbi:hypothetical protein [Arthrobacter sp. zg-Y1116]|uniref:hypothetical protein n=1 Tax=Arthrobacter sp. zg-Y1116 TaxID=2964611 RepID=UPI002107D876|nr:hypothetical protein [Arthrobacter sp. zg-Y1116]MCQ1947587.1 hypothetical protein [Arthrobacter sp. zg-Y1116]